MVTKNDDEEGSAKKFRVKCDTCRIAQTYYTEVGVRYFRSQHTGHRVVNTGSSYIYDEDERDSTPYHRSETTSSLGKEGLATVQIMERPKMRVLSPIVASELPKVTRPITEQKVAQAIVVQEEEERKSPRKAAPKQQKAKSPASAHPSTTSSSETQDLLLGKFSFIKEGCAKEARNVSSVLRGFRWKVEPPYVIGALFDDNLSIQSNTGVISREMIMGIEQLGYYFVAVECPKCVPTAWFKKESGK